MFEKAFATESKTSGRVRALQAAWPPWEPAPAAVSCLCGFLCGLMQCWVTVFMRRIYLKFSPKPLNLLKNHKGLSKITKFFKK